MSGLGRLLPPSLRRTAGLAHGPAGRHRARANLSLVPNALALRRKIARLRGGDRRQPVLTVGLLEHAGDIVAAEPIIRHLKRENPDARLLWVVGRQYRELIECHALVDAVLPIGCMTEWIRLAQSGALGGVIDLHLPGRSCSVCQEPYERPRGENGIDIGNYYHHGNLLEIFCKTAGLTVLNDGPALRLPEGCRAAVDRLGLPDEFVVFHCRSNQEARDWNDEKWRGLAARAARDLGVSVAEVGLRSVLNGRDPGTLDLCGRLSLLETAEVIRRARVFVGIDSGPAHLANAVGTFGVILLGHYRSYRRYLPYSGGYADGSNADLIYADGPASSLPVERVHRAMAARLGRRGEEAADGAQFAA